MAELPSTWAPRDLPILTAALRRLDTGEGFPDLGDLERDTGLSTEQIWAGLNALKTAEPPYVLVEGPAAVAVSERGADIR
jgi:hypothetical protein